LWSLVRNPSAAWLPYLKILDPTAQRKTSPERAVPKGPRVLDIVGLSCELPTLGINAGVKVIQNVKSDAALCVIEDGKIGQFAM